MAKRIPLTDISRDSGLAREKAAPAPDDIIADIRSLYFRTTKATIERDFDRAIDLLKSLPTVEHRQRVHVYMEGLAEMRKEWKRASGKLRMTNDE